MNCKPGDLAYAFRPGPYFGRYFFVLEAAPVGVEFKLPDGYTHLPCGPGEWVLESASGPFEVPTTTGRRLTRFGAGKDAGLRPIRDNDGEDEILRLVGKPDEVPA